MLTDTTGDTTGDLRLGQVLVRAFNCPWPASLQLSPAKHAHSGVVLAHGGGRRQGAPCAQVGMLLLAGSCGGAMLLPLLATLPCHIFWHAPPPQLHSCVRHALLRSGGCAKNARSASPQRKSGCSFRAAGYAVTCIQSPWLALQRRQALANICVICHCIYQESNQQEGAYLLSQLSLYLQGSSAASAQNKPCGYR